MDYISFPISPVIAEATYWKLRRDVNTRADKGERTLFDDYELEDIRDKVILRNDKFNNYSIYPISSLSDNNAPDLYGHEVISGNNPAKLYIDLDCKNVSNISVLYRTEQEFIISVIFPILSAINDQFYIQYVIDTADTLCLHTSDDGDDFVIMSSTDISRGIFSYHILFAPTRYAFASTAIIREFMNQVIEQLHLDGNSDIARMIDMGVYSTNHNLRTCGAAKQGDNPRVKRLLNHVYPDLFDRSPDTAFQPRKNKLRWVDTLISYVNRDMTIIGDDSSNGISTAIGQSFIVMAENEYDNVLINFVNNQLIAAGHMEGFKHTSTRINPRTSENILNTVIYKKREMDQYIANVSYHLYYTRIAPSFCTICQRVHDKENSMSVYVYQNDQLCIRIYCKRNFANKYITIRESAEDIINKCHIANIDIESRLTLLSDSPEIVSDSNSAGESESDCRGRNNTEEGYNKEEESAPKVRKTIPILKASKLNMSNKMLELLANKTGADEVRRIAEFLNRTKFASLPNKIIYDEPNMRDLVPFDECPELPKTLFVDAAMRLGKTKKLIELIDRYYPLTIGSSEKSKSKICILTFRQTFARHMIGQFEASGFEIYDKIVGPICSNKHPRIILQIESMHRLLIRNYGQHEALHFDVLIMDECESIFDQIDSGLSQRFGESFAVFEWLFRYSKTVIMMDAFIGDRSYDIVEHIRSLLGSVYHQNTYARSAEDKYDITCDLENWLKQLLDAVRGKKRIVITSNTKTQAEALYTMLNQIDVSIRIMIYSQDTAANVKLLHSSNVNKFWTNYDILIYTPTISAGVSFEISHYDMLFGYFVSTSCTAESAIQMMGRIRCLRDNSYKIYCSRAFISTNYYPTSIAEIESCVRRRYFSLMNTIDLSNVIIEYTMNGDILINKSSYYYIWLHNTIVKNLSRKMFINRLVMLLLKSGAQIESLCLKSDNMTPAEITATLKECAEQNKSNKAESIAFAVNLTDLEYVELKSRHDKQKMSSGYMFSEHKPTPNADDIRASSNNRENNDMNIQNDNLPERSAEELRDEMLDKLGMNVRDISGDNIGDVFAIDVTPADQAAMRKHYLRTFYKLPSFDCINTIFVTIYDTDRSRSIYKQLNQLVPILPLSSKAEEILSKNYNTEEDDLRSGECVDNIELCIEKIRREEFARISYAPAPANQSCIKSEDICGNSLLDHKNSKYVHLSSKHRVLNQLVRFLGWKHVLDMKDKYISKAEVMRNIKDNYMNIVNLASDISSQFSRHKWLSVPVSGLDLQSLKVHLIIAPINQLLEDFYDLKIVKLEHGKIEMYNIRFVKELFIFDSIEHRYRPVYTVIPK